MIHQPTAIDYVILYGAMLVLLGLFAWCVAWAWHDHK